MGIRTPTHARDTEGGAGGWWNVKIHRVTFTANVFDV